MSTSSPAWWRCGTITSLRILRTIAQAAPAGARLLVVEMVVLGLFGSESRWRALLADGGFTLQRVVTAGYQAGCQSPAGSADQRWCRLIRQPGSCRT